MKLKKLASVFLAAVMAVSLATTAFAAVEGSEQTGSITVTAKSAGRQLVAYRLFDSTKAVKADGTETYGYRVNEGYRDKIIAALVAALGEGSVSNDLVADLATINKDNSAKAKTFALSMQNALKDSNADVALTEGTPKNGKTPYTATDVPLGYYIIFDTAEGSEEYAPTFAMLTPADTDVQVEAKDSAIDATKKLQTDTDGKFTSTGNVNIGDTVTYKITGDIPAYASANNDKYEVRLTDTLPDSGQLQYIGIESVVLSGNGIVNPFVPGDVVFKDANGDTVEPAKATSFVFEKPVIDKEKSVDYLNDNHATITITYTAKVVDADAIVDENTNTYKYEYGNPTNVAGLTSLPEKRATVYTYGFKIYKYTGTGENETALAGAEFSLKKKGDSKALKFNIDSNNNYVYDPDGNVTTLVSDGNGSISILGLDAGTYVLEETKAPNGYNLLANTIDITITPKLKDNIENADCTVSYQLTGADGAPTEVDDYTYTVKVLNTTGTTLPSTGGMGTTLFTAGGLLILCAAGAFLYLNRKRLFSR